MSRTAVALIALAVLVVAGQWLWLRVAARLDPHLVPACSRRRISWISTNSMHIIVAAGGLAACAICAQVVLSLSA